MKKLLIRHLQVYTEKKILKKSAVLLQDNRIHAIENVNHSGAEILTFPETYHLVPGFIDLHTHGVAGKDVMDADPVGLAVIAQMLAQEGTTGFLATTLTAEKEKLESVLSVVGDYINAQDRKWGAKLLGVHLEGPFLSAKKVGAQSEQHLCLPDIALLQAWQKRSKNNIKLVTLAPELANSLDCIRFLKQNNIIASIGHTDATFAESHAAIEKGCTHATHLFNAMRSIHQREPGAVTAALLSDQVMVELIVDGVHLHPAIVKMVLKLKGTEKIALVTDAMRAKCLADGIYDLGGQAVKVEKNKAHLADGTLAGSVLKMNSAIQNMLDFTGCSLFDAIKMAAGNPAKALGMFSRIGSIEVGKEADLVVLDENLQVVLTICQGEIVYRKSLS